MSVRYLLREFRQCCVYLHSFTFNISSFIYYSNYLCHFLYPHVPRRLSLHLSINLVIFIAFSISMSQVPVHHLRVACVSSVLPVLYLHAITFLRLFVYLLQVLYLYLFHHLFVQGACPPSTGRVCSVSAAPSRASSTPRSSPLLRSGSRGQGHGVKDIRLCSHSD